VEKICPKFCATYAIFKTLPKVNNHPIGESSSNLVTLIWIDLLGRLKGRKASRVKLILGVCAQIVHVNNVSAEAPSAKEQN
jgi:hypothetical protein